MKHNLKPLLAMAVIIGIIYFAMDALMGDNFDKSKVADYQNDSNSKNKVDCTWCGGVGSVGYAGESEAQVRRTGMGLGNKCIRCKGSGKLEK
jgi:hypothetical protein